MIPTSVGGWPVSQPRLSVHHFVRETHRITSLNAGSRDLLELWRLTFRYLLTTWCLRSWVTFQHSILFAIEGYVALLLILRILNQSERQVCRRVYLASKERCIWVNVFARTKCALPPVDLNATTTQELERMVLRAEIMDAKWTGSRRPAPQFYQSPLPRGRSFFVGSMGRCTVLAHQTAGETRYAWYQTRNLEDPIFEYHIPSPLLQNPVCHVELGTNILHLAYIPQKPAAQQQFL